MRRVHGYYDMGRIRIPPLSPNIIMTDRGDGTLWHLSYSITPPADDGFGYISINSTLPVKPDKTTFGPYEGPYLASNPYGLILRFLVRDGYLGYEISSQPPWLRDQDNGYIMARRGLQRSARRIIIPTGWIPNDDPTSIADVTELAWEPMNF